MFYKIDGISATLNDILLKVHDKYISADDTSFLNHALVFGVYEKKWGKLKKAGSIRIHPVEEYSFKDSEGIEFYSINEFQFDKSKIIITLNERNVIELNCIPDNLTIELTL